MLLGRLPRLLFDLAGEIQTKHHRRKNKQTKRRQHGSPCCSSSSENKTNIHTSGRWITRLVCRWRAQPAAWT